MLPFDQPPSGSFTTGQRLRPSASRPAVGISHSKRTHILTYGSHNGKPHAQPFCTRTKCLGFIILIVCAMLYMASASRPIEDLQKDIALQTATDNNGAGSDEPPPPAQALLPSDAVLVERAQKAAVSAKLAQAQAELSDSQATIAKLQSELESAQTKLTQQAASAVTTPPPAAQLSVAAGGTRALSTINGPIEVPGYPPIAIASTRKYSKFYCIGGRGRLGAQNDRSCRFQNLCYKPSTNAWVFYQDPAESLVVLLDKGQILSEFPEQFLNLRSMGNPQDAQWWSPSIVKDAQGIPAESFSPRSDPLKPDVNLLYHPHYPSNMGHVIGDDLFPLFNLMSSFGMLVPNANLILSRDCSKIFANNPKKAGQCDFFLKMLTPGLSSKQPYLAATASDFAERVTGKSGSSTDLVCFEQLLAGNGPWGFQQSLGKAPAWWSYHAFYLSNLGINPNRTPKKHRITVSIKKGKRGLANNDELVAYLRKEFPSYEIDALELKSLGGWKAELEYLLDTTVLITPCGGVSMSAMFLPHNSAMIIVDYFNLKKNVSFGMEERLWSNLGYVRPFHYPFSIEEVEMPADHPSRTDYQEMRDWGQVRVDTKRMGTIVRSAISHVDNFMVMGQE